MYRAACLIILCLAAMPTLEAMAANGCPPDLENPGGMMAEAKHLRREINLHNLYNGLHFSVGQLERLVEISRRGQTLSEECFGPRNGRGEQILETYRRILDCVRKGRSIPKALEGMGGLMEIAERRLRQRYIHGITALERDVWTLLTPAQREIIKGYDPCLIPPRNLKDPVRVGQADTYETEKSILEAARKMADDRFDSDCRNLLAAHLSGLEKHLGPMDPATKKREMDRMSTVCRQARSLPAVEFEIRADEFAAALNLDVQHDMFKEKAEAFFEIIRRYQGGAIGKVAQHFLDPLCPAILEQRLAEARLAPSSAPKTDLEKVEGARPSGEGCAVKPGQEGFSKKTYTVGELAALLGLMEPAKSRFAEIVRKAKAAQLRLMRIPMKDGTTPISKMLDLQKLPASRRAAMLGTFFSALQEPIPGRDASYMEYFLRIKISMDEQFRKVLRPDQYEKLCATVEDFLDHIEPGNKTKMHFSEFASKLELTPQQCEKVRPVIARGQAESWKLLSIRAADGKTPLERILTIQTMSPAEQKEAFAAFIESLSQTVPGRKTTYAREIEMIKRDVHQGIEEALNADQLKTWKRMTLDVLDLEMGE